MFSVATGRAGNNDWIAGSPRVLARPREVSTESNRDAEYKVTTRAERASQFSRSK